VLSAGDHVLVTDNVYRPSRNFRNGMLAAPPKSRMRGATLRPRIGLENVDDLKGDLDAALQR